MRFLVADDFAPARQTLCQLIESHPGWYVVASAVDGLKAIRQAMAHNPHIVLIDVIVPALDGIRAARRIKAASPATRVIVYTAHHNSAFRRRALSAGADAFFLKEELDFSTLEALVRRWFPEEPEE